MKLLKANEEFIIIEKNEQLDVIYSPYSNRVLAMNKEGIACLKAIMEVIKNNKKIEILFEEFCEEDVKSLINILVENRFLFLNDKDLQAADYSRIYKEKTFFSIHKAYLHLTQRCNLKCEYCYNASNIGKTKDMSTQQWKNIILELKNKSFDYIVFTGGEVFLRKDLRELTDYVKQLKMKLHILTNGTFRIPEEIIEKADIVEISLDAIDENINEANRKNSKKYGVYNNILQIPERLRDKVVIKTVLSKTNFDLILEMKEQLERCGFINNEVILQQPNSAEETDIYPDKILPRKKHRFDAKTFAKCNGCYEVIAINADGGIYPCQALIKENLLLANIFEKNWIEKVKSSKITRIFMENDITTSECRVCAYRYICGGPCKAVSYNTTNSFYEGRGNYCERAKKESIGYLKSIDFGE